MNDNGKIKKTVPGITKAFDTFLFPELVGKIKVSGRCNESESIRNIEDREAVMRKCEMSAG